MRSLLLLCMLIAAAGCASAKHVISGGCAREWRPMRASRYALQLVPGEARALGRPYVMDGPFGDREVEKGCPTLWRVQSGPARVDRHGTLHVAADATPGAEISVLVYAAGVWGGQTAYVVSPLPNPLAGTWSQKDAHCAGDLPPAGRIGELIFMRNGRYALTERPFERQYDYIGSYRFDAVSGRLQLSEGVPDAGGSRYSEHTARYLPDGTLEITDLQRWGLRCTVTFTATGGEP